MKYILMHKRIAVAELEIDNASCAITGIDDIYAPEHVPVGISVFRGAIDRKALNNWWRKRAIPASRDGIRRALEELQVSSSEALLEKCYGLSLSDQYWICPKAASITWDDINFFDNSFSEDVGNVLLGHASSSDSISLMSPDNSSDGWLKKKWTILNGKRCLLKGGSGIVQQEPYNEVLATTLMNRLDISCVQYSLIMKNSYPYSICEDFITKDTELISAQHFMDGHKKPNNFSVYQHFVKCCEKVGIKAAVDFLDRMLTVDFLIANEDRHFNNFGLIRDAESLEYIGMAPIYDNGTSLWYKTPNHMIRPSAPKLPSKPFKSAHAEQIKLVSSFAWLDHTRLKGLDEEYYEILKESPFIDEARRGILCAALKTRVELITEIAAK